MYVCMCMYVCMYVCMNVWMDACTGILYICNVLFAGIGCMETENIVNGDRQ